MGKKQKEKSKKQKIEKMNNNSSMEVNNIIKITIIVLIIFACVYFFTALLTGKINFGNNNNDSDVIIQYEEILAGESFDQSEAEYLVLFYDFNGIDAGIYSNLLYNYELTSAAIKYYTVDMSSGMNQLYKVNSDEVSALNVSKASELKIKDATLIRFVNNKIANYYEGNAAIEAYFKNFSK